MASVADILGMSEDLYGLFIKPFDISLGSFGVHVKKLQDYLIGAGFLPASVAHDALAYGRMGPETLAGVNKLQKTIGFVVSDIWSWDYINAYERYLTGTSIGAETTTTAQDFNSVAGKVKNIVVGAGETLYDIAMKLYGDPAYVPYLEKWNNLQGGTVEAGSTLKTADGFVIAGMEDKAPTEPPKRPQSVEVDPWGDITQSFTWLEPSDMTSKTQENTESRDKFHKGKHAFYLCETGELPVCYVKNLRTNREIKFASPPQELREAYTNNFDAQATRGRSAPYQGYTSSGPHTLDFNITLYDDYCTEGLVQTVTFLRALCYPEKANQGQIISPLCEFILGEFIVVRKAICNSVNVSWKMPFNKDKTYRIADVAISLTEVVDATQLSRNVESFASVGFS